RRRAGGACASRRTGLNRRLCFRAPQAERSKAVRSKLSLDRRACSKSRSDKCLARTLLIDIRSETFSYRETEGHIRSAHAGLALFIRGAGADSANRHSLVGHKGAANRQALHTKPHSAKAS